MGPPTVDAPAQAVILLRLRETSEDGDAVPAGLANIAGRPFVDRLIENCLRFGFRNLLLLSDDAGACLSNYAASMRARLPAGATVGVRIDATARTSVAALRFAADQLHDRFLLLDGDKLFDFNWLDLMVSTGLPSLPLLIAAHPRGSEAVDGGVYLIDKKILGRLDEDTSLAGLARTSGADGYVSREYDGFFTSVSDPAGRARAEVEFESRRVRGAVFFDRDGTINVDTGYAFRPDDLAFIPGAVAAVKRVNDSGRYAFLVTNQSGIARGYYTESNMHAFHAHMQRHLRAAGAHFDDIRFCPYHPDGTVARYARSSDWRKPAPGMLLDLLSSWPVDRDASFVVGNTQADMRAAEAAGLRGLLFGGGDLDQLLAPVLQD